MSKTVVELKDVSIFQRKNLILHDINLTIERGEFVYLIGKTGSGKSSLLKILYGDLPLKKGTGMAVDFNLATLKESEIPYLRRKILSCSPIGQCLVILSLFYVPQVGMILIR